MPPFSMRLMIWYLRNKTPFTRPGYEQASKSFNPNDLSPADVSFSAVVKKTVIVTGANSGIGLSCALECARRGANVHLVCRNEERGREARESIVKETGNEDVHLHVVAMDDLHGLARFAKDFSDTYPSLDVLINNAGCMIHERKLTKDGVEYNFAVNTLGTYVLTMHLMPALSRSKDARVITVSSGGMMLEKLDPSDFAWDKREFKGDEVYAQQKRQQVVMMTQLAQRFPKPVKFYSMHPGWADTAAFREALPDFYEKMKKDLRTPYQGADTAIWLALVKEVPDSFNGQFLQDRVPVSQHLPLVWTKSTKEEEELFMKNLDALVEKLNLTPKL